jgi:hypothetical protein
VCTLAGGFIVFLRKTEFLQKFRRRVFSRSFLKLSLRYFIINSIGIFIIGLLFPFIYHFLFDSQLLVRDIVYMSGAFTVSAFLGFVVPGSPAGLGVREYSLIVLLASTYGETNILIASLIYRIISITADSGVFVAGEFLLRQEKNKIN